MDNPLRYFWIITSSLMIQISPSTACSELFGTMETSWQRNCIFKWITVGERTKINTFLQLLPYWSCSKRQTRYIKCWVYLINWFIRFITIRLDCQIYSHINQNWLVFKCLYPFKKKTWLYQICSAHESYLNKHLCKVNFMSFTIPTITVVNKL